VPEETFTHSHPGGSTGLGECFFWYWPTRVVLDKGPLNGAYTISYQAVVPKLSRRTIWTNTAQNAVTDSVLHTYIQTNLYSTQNCANEFETLPLFPHILFSMKTGTTAHQSIAFIQLI